MKNNKLIAEFMGDEFTLMPDTDGKCYTLKGSWDIIHEDDFIVDKAIFAFDTSWDILMPVVEKIESDEKYDVDILQYGTVIRTEYRDIVNNVADISFGNKIEHTYQAVVEFIEWYNKN